MNTLSDYITAIGGAASQVVSAVNQPKTAAASQPKASSGIPRGVIFAVIGVVVLIGGFLILRRR